MLSIKRGAFSNLREMVNMQINDFRHLATTVRNLYCILVIVESYYRALFI